MKEGPKTIFTELRHPLVECPQGHSYRVSLKYFKRNVRKRRNFVCSQCVTAFRARP